MSINNNINKKIHRNKLTISKIILSDDEDNEDNENNNIISIVKSNKSKSNKSNKSKIKDNFDSDDETDSDVENSNSNANIIKIPHVKFQGYDTNVISNYIVANKITEFGSSALLCHYLWSGVDELDKWELNRKIDDDLVKKLVLDMKDNYKLNGKFEFYEPVHLGLKKNNIFYVIDGQHRILAYNKLQKKNKYPVQQIPCVIWFPKDDDEFIKIFDKINSRTPIDKTKLFNYKINDIIKWLENEYGSNIWGKNRPKINKEIFVNNMRSTDAIHKLETTDIINKIKLYNEKVRGMSRNNRTQNPINNSIHNNAETMNFYLGYDKELNWIMTEFIT